MLRGGLLWIKIVVKSYLKTETLGFNGMTKRKSGIFRLWI